MIAILVGHSRGDGGAVSVGGMNEWHFNRDLGGRIHRQLLDRGLKACMIDSYAQTSYGRSMELLARSLKSMGVSCAVELHFNSSDRVAARGHEWLHWHSSVAGRALAQCLDRRMSEDFPNHPRRGLISIRSEADRGGSFLRKTHCPAVIAEPFFGSSPIDWEMATTRKDVLAGVIADGIDDWKGDAA